MKVQKKRWNEVKEMPLVRHIDQEKLAKSIALLLFAVFFCFILSANVDAQSYEWWNASWHYRVLLEINSTSYSRADWPVEHEINFTSILNELGVSETFDRNSTKVFEYNSSGSLLYEVTSQFDVSDNFDASSNADGTLVFLMNGSTQANAKRYYHVYFNTIEKGSKEQPNYSSDLNYVWDGEEFHVNNSILSWFVDTVRGENTSGIYRVRGIASGYEIFYIPEEINNTLEYIQYSNATHNFTFDFMNNASFSTGPVRMTVEQIGEEAKWGDSNNKTNEGKIAKKYVFYSNNPWIRIEQTFTNLAGNEITRDSTPAGALAFDVERGFGSGYLKDGNSEDPSSWYWASYSSGGRLLGLMNLNESGTTNYVTIHSSETKRIGIHLNETNISAGNSITEKAIVYFNDTEAASNLFEDLRNNLNNPVGITQHASEAWAITIDPQTDEQAYNRNETILITGNVTYDSDNLTTLMNATFDMGTPGTGDDITIVLYDDATHGDETSGDKVFANYFTLSNSSVTGQWNITLKAYDNESYFLNQNSTFINVTDNYNVTTSVINPEGLVNRIINATISVKNYRQDTWIANAVINCSHDSTYLNNVTDYGNGTYLLSFQGPGTAGPYTLNCSASKDGNFGWNTDDFIVEADKVYLNIDTAPENYTAFNVTWINNESFSLVVNTTNTIYGIARNISMNLSSLILEANSTYEGCNNLDQYETCSKSFLITVPNATPPGVYSLNITIKWKNPDTTIGYNYSIFNVTVASNPLIDVKETNILSIISPEKEKNIGNLTINSTGNDALSDIIFNVSGFPQGFEFEFIPENISTLNAGDVTTVKINVTTNVSAGYYNGIINISTGNNGYDEVALNLTVSGTNCTIDVSPENYTATNITTTVNESFEVTVNTTNIGNVTAWYSNITFELPQNWITNATINGIREPCGDLMVNESCSNSFLITVANLTSSGNYLVNVSIVWEDTGSGVKSSITSINVTVTSNVVMDIQETIVEENLTQGTESNIGNFTINSTGNDDLLNITYGVSGLPGDFTIEFIPNITELAAGNSQIIMVNSSVSSGYPPGSYEGIVNISTSNAGWRNLTLNITVPPSKTWTMTPDECEHYHYPDYGEVCKVNITNTGNLNISFNITPSEGNHSWVNETNFMIQKQESHIFSVLYNVTNADRVWYNSSYTINATDADPLNMILTIKLNPLIGPLVNASSIPNMTMQLNSVEIFANVTDRSYKGIDWVEAIITQPGGTIYKANMSLYVNITGNISTWNITYPGTWGNTSYGGTYDVLVRAIDKDGVPGEATTSFYVYPRLFVELKTYQLEYGRGDAISIYYKAKDAAGIPLENVNATITIEDPSGNLSFQNFDTSNSNGTIPMPPFTIPSDAIFGNYSLKSVSTYYDKYSSQTVNNTQTVEFKVVEQVTGELSAQLYSSVTDSRVDFYIIVKTVNTSQEPHMTLKVYNLTGLYFEESNFTLLNKTNSTFIYTYNHTVTSGFYVAILNVSKDGLNSETSSSFSAPVSTKKINVEIVALPICYADNNVKFSILVKDEFGEFINATNVSAVLYDNNWNTIIPSFYINQFSTGWYYVQWDIPSSTSGQYWLYTDAIVDGTTGSDVETFMVLVGGPFKFEIDAPTEAYIGDDMSFLVEATNEGNADTESKFSCWIDVNEEKGSEIVWQKLISAGETYAENKTILVPTSLIPENSYQLKCELYALNSPYNITYAVDTFIAKSQVSPPTPGGGGAAAPVTPTAMAVTKIPKLEIVELFPMEINVERGGTTYLMVKIKNSGEVDLYSILSVLEGIPSSWFRVMKGESILTIGEYSFILIKLDIPVDAEIKNYNIKVKVVSDKIQDERYLNLRVFESKKELVEYLIEKEKKNLEEVKLKALLAQKEEKDVTTIFETLEYAEEYIKLAEAQLESEQYSKSLSSLQNANDLIEKANHLLLKAEVVEVSVFIPFIPYPVYIAAIIIVISILVIIYLIKKIKEKEILRGKELKDIRRTVMAHIPKPKKTETQENLSLLEKEKKETQSLLQTIEREHERGIISDKTYNELKKENEKKLSEIESSTVCENCGTINESDAKFCVACGSKL